MADEVMWALYPWAEQDGTDLIHPDDLERFRQLSPTGVVFTVLPDEGDYTVLGSGTERFRVRPDRLRLIKPDESWLFEIGDQVAVPERGYAGKIVEIRWHWKEHQPMFFLRVNGKPKSKRYWPRDLVKITEP